MSEDMAGKVTILIPLQRFGDAEIDISGTYLFLTSEAASYISGEIITLQGRSGLRP